MASPVPKIPKDKDARREMKTILEEREGLRLAFLNGLDYNVSPKNEGVRHKRNPFVVHFKGETKAWMARYAREFVL